MPDIRKIRDLSLIELPGDMVMVTSCDSLGAIGAKELDVIKVPGYFVGRAITRVALMEIMATGAEFVALYNMLSVEMDPSGREIIRGISDELTKANIDPVLALNGSTEENIVTCQTGVGVVALGLVSKKELLLGKGTKGDLVIAFGLPKVGEEVSEGGPNDPEVAQPSLIKKLICNGGVKELLPVGSKGILYECDQLAQTVNLVFSLDKDITVDINKSAGPATCLLAVVSANLYETVKSRDWQVPWQIVGCLE